MIDRRCSDDQKALIVLWSPMGDEIADHRVSQWRREPKFSSKVGFREVSRFVFAYANVRCPPCLISTLPLRCALVE